MIRADLEKALERLPSNIRIALLHHARGETRLCREFLELYLTGVPANRGYNAPMTAADVAHEIQEREART
jgi:hypothetical protein